MVDGVGSVGFIPRLKARVFSLLYIMAVHGAHIPEAQVRLLVPQWRTTMGLFDTVELYDDVHLPEYPDGLAPAEDVDWQTKGIDRPTMTTFRITADGRLLEEEWHTEAVPPEDRPYASRDDVDEDDFRYMAGSRNRVAGSNETTTTAASSSNTPSRISIHSSRIK